MHKLREAMSSTICNKGTHFMKKGKGVVGTPNCDVLEYMGMSRSAAWVPPTPGSNEGPARFGLQHPFCQDCDYCAPVQLQCLAGESSNRSRFIDLDVEYVPMLFTTDRVLQSTEGATTQDTIAAYLRKRTPRADAIIMNTGTHELEDFHGMQAEDYVQRVRGNLKRLHGSAKLIIWILTNSQLKSAFSVGTQAEWNEKIAAWNEAVRAMIVKEFSDVFILDVFKMSQMNNMRIDNVHMVPSYYVAEAQMILGFLSRRLFQDAGSVLQVGSDLGNSSSTVRAVEAGSDGELLVNVEKSVDISAHGAIAVRKSSSTSGQHTFVRKH